jgi:hypothetical protein
MLSLMSGWELVKLSSRKRYRKDWLHIEGTRPPTNNIHMLSSKPFQILFIASQIFQNCLVLHMKWRKLNVME